MAIVAALNAGTGGLDGAPPCAAYRTRVDALQAGELPAYIVRAVDEQIERKSTDIVLRVLTVRVECHSAGQAPQDMALDPLLNYAVQVLFVNDALAALIKGLEESRIQWDIEPALEEQALAALDFQVIYATRATDPTVQRG